VYRESLLRRDLPVTEEEALAWECYADLLARMVALLSILAVHIQEHPEAYRGRMGEAVRERVEVELKRVQSEPAPESAKRPVLRRMIDEQRRTSR